MAEVNLGKVMGSRIHFIDSTTPSPALGLINDLAFNTSTGKVWEKLSSGWEYKGSLKGSAAGVPDDIKTWNLETNHPVGSWWISDNPTSPADLFGGIWEKVEGRFILGAESKHPVGSTGGAFEIVQTLSQMPEHRHNDIYYKGNTKLSKDTGGTSLRFMTGTEKNGSDASGVLSTGLSGGGEAMNITNPYYATYMWRRTA